MIKLILNLDSKNKTFCFDKKEIIIGHSSNPHADLPIDQPDILPVHLKIIQEKHQWFIFNSSNDPFASINGIPFGKKILKHLDRIESEGFFITCNLSCLTEESKTPSEQTEKTAHSNSIATTNILPSSSRERTEEKCDLPHATIYHGHPQTSSPGSLSPHPKEKKTSPLTFFQEREALPKKPKMPLPKEDDLRDEDSESLDQNQLEEESNKSNKQKRLFKKAIFFFLAAVLISATICFGIYFREDGRNSQEEKKIAAGVADIAVGLTQAKLNHMTPEKQNWLDPDFLQNILSRVIAPSLHTQAQINRQGHFIDYPYRLRVYTSKNMDRFLVIAQPSPHLMQWFVHRKTIVIDSNSMEMRKITDLKTLNRLLTNPHPLEERNGEEIARVLKESSIMSLDSLAGYENQWGFTPPKALQFIRPGAENYVYNAPRYYPFGEELLKKAIHLYENPSSSSEVALLQEEMEEISKFPDIALYTSQGLQMAVEAQKALNMMAPHSRFLVAYVKFTPKGAVASSHLLMNEDQKELASLDSSKKTFPTPLNSSYSLERDDPLHDQEEDLLFQIDEPQEEVDPKHPVYLQLNSLHAARKKALSTLSVKMEGLLNQNNQTFTPGFEKQFKDLFQRYVKINQQQNRKIMQELTALSQNYSETPLAELLKFVENANLTPFAEEVLNIRKQQLQDPSPTTQDIERRFRKIEKTQTLNQLHDQVLELFNLLTLKSLPDLQLLIFYQDLMHEKVLKKLGFFLLSPSSLYASSPFEAQDRSTLIHILEHAWVYEPEERDYFLSEFEIHYEEKPAKERKAF